jgi:oligopeptide transport system substrate-binding protein
MQGKLDYLEIPKDNFAQAITPQKNLSPEMKVKGIELGISKSPSNVYYFGFNNKDKNMKNVHLRRAIAYAFDQYKYNELFFNGTAAIANTLLPPGLAGNNPPLISPYLGSQIKKAKEELKLAGHPNGVGLGEIVLTVKNSSLARQVAEFFVQEMSKVGIKARLDMVSWGKLLDKANKGSYQIFYLAWFVGLPTGFEFFNLLYGPNWPGSYNRMGHINPEFDDLYDKSLASTEKSVHKKNFRLMNKIALMDVPLLPLVHAKTFYLKNAWLKNYVPAEIAGGLEQYYDIDLVSKKELLSKD